MHDLVVIGTSIASGVGRGIDRTVTSGAVKSWIYHLADMIGARNVWNHSLPGKSMGLVNADGAEFAKQYERKYGNCDDLFMVLEYSLPSYRHWDPVMSARADCKEIIPVTYFTPFKHKEDASNPMYYYGNDRFMESRFYVRDVGDMIGKVDHQETYHEVTKEYVVPEQLAQFEAQALDWFQPTQANSLRYLRYAYDEVMAAQDFLEGRNITFMQTWVGGVTDSYKRAVDRYMSPLMKTKKLVPMKEFTAITATLDWSIKPFRNHPDDAGHYRIAEFYHDWITNNNLFTPTQSELFHFSGENT